MTAAKAVAATSLKIEAALEQAAADRAATSDQPIIFSISPKASQIFAADRVAPRQGVPQFMRQADLIFNAPYVAASRPVTIAANCVKVEPRNCLGPTRPSAPARR